MVVCMFMLVNVMFSVGGSLHFVFLVCACGGVFNVMDVCVSFVSRIMMMSGEYYFISDAVYVDL